MDSLGKILTKLKFGWFFWWWFDLTLKYTKRWFSRSRVFHVWFHSHILKICSNKNILDENFDSKRQRKRCCGWLGNWQKSFLPGTNVEFELSANKIKEPQFNGIKFRCFHLIWDLLWQCIISILTWGGGEQNWFLSRLCFLI